MSVRLYLYEKPIKENSAIKSTTSTPTKNVNLTPETKEKTPVNIILSQKDNKKPNTDIAKTLSQFKQQLHDIDKCFYETCSIEKEISPKSADLALYTKIENELNVIQHWQQQHRVHDPRISEFAASFLAYDKGSIKIKSLQIIATQAPNKNIVPALLDHVIDHPQPESIAYAMKELSRFDDANIKKTIMLKSIASLSHGSIYSAIEIAKHLPQNIIQENYSTYQDVLTELSQQPLSQEIYFALKKRL
ncbi:MAG: hypothetical protein H6623_07360 [Bdellovibrionaceae bacterium]|nr:hypothetical protein [Pseudobdellovibrionaceae bacterium]